MYIKLYLYIYIYPQNASICEPRVPTGSLGVKSHNIYPLECRQRHGTYSGRLEVKLLWTINGVDQMIIDRDIGQVPIMLKVITNYIYFF